MSPAPKVEIKPSEQDARKALSHLRAVRRLATYALQITDIGDLEAPAAMERLAAIPLDDYLTLGEAMQSNLKRLNQYATASHELHTEGI